MQYIICPICGRRFILKIIKKNNKEILKGTLICAKKHKFGIKNGIPRLVVDHTINFVKTKDAFSSKWKNFNKTYHSRKWLVIKENGFLNDLVGKQS